MLTSNDYTFMYVLAYVCPMSMSACRWVWWGRCLCCYCKRSCLFLFFSFQQNFSSPYKFSFLSSIIHSIYCISLAFTFLLLPLELYLSCQITLEMRSAQNRTSFAYALLNKRNFFPPSSYTVHFKWTVRIFFFLSKWPELHILSVVFHSA